MFAALTQPLQHGDLNFKMTAVEVQRGCSLQVLTGRLIPTQNGMRPCSVGIVESGVRVKSNGIVEVLDGLLALVKGLVYLPPAPGSQTRVEVLHGLSRGRLLARR